MTSASQADFPDYQNIVSPREESARRVTLGIALLERLCKAIKAAGGESVTLNFKGTSWQPAPMADRELPDVERGNDGRPTEAGREELKAREGAQKAERESYYSESIRFEGLPERGDPVCHGAVMPMNG